ELLRLAGRPGAPVPSCSGMAVPTDYALLIFSEVELARAALEEAANLLQATVADETFDVAAAITRIRAVAREVCFGPNSSAIVRAARTRGIPVRRLSRGSLIMLGQGVKQRRLRTAETDRTNAIAKFISSDKGLTKTLLRAVGVPVPEGRLVS